MKKIYAVTAQEKNVIDTIKEFVVVFDYNPRKQILKITTNACGDFMNNSVTFLLYDYTFKPENAFSILKTIFDTLNYDIDEYITL